MPAFHCIQMNSFMTVTTSQDKKADRSIYVACNFVRLPVPHIVCDEAIMKITANSNQSDTALHDLDADFLLRYEVTC